MDKPWQCGVCLKPIPSGVGYLEIFNANPKLGPLGRYPINATPDGPPEESDQIEQLGAAIMYLATDPNIGFRAVCKSCPGYEHPYSIALSDLQTIDRYMAWVFHLQEKTWMSHTDTMRMLYFWWSGRGLKTPRLHQ